MNYFIDFDHTLYKTPLLTTSMLNALSSYISCNSNYSSQTILKELTLKFRRGQGGIYNIYQLINYFSNLPNYHFNIQEATNIVNNVVSNGSIFLYDDSISFLDYLKKQGNNVYILSYNENDTYFQALKIAGSGILHLVDGIIPTTTMKGDMPLDFKNSIFIDDNPKDLISIYNRNPYKIYRIRRKNDTYSKEETNLPIPEYEKLTDLMETNYMNVNSFP